MTCLTWSRGVVVVVPCFTSTYKMYCILLLFLNRIELKYYFFFHQVLRCVSTHITMMVLLELTPSSGSTLSDVLAIPQS